jgi:hypothetical protein
MSIFGADLGRIVDEDISIRVTQYDVIYEAITNAIIAGATKINCEFNALEQLLGDNGETIVRKKVDTITISDNGKGFTDENYKAFCTYRTDQHKDLGCKGIGRLIYLKVYEDATFKSELFNEQQIRSFKFIRDFDPDKLKKENLPIESNLTEVKLSRLTLKYRNSQSQTDKRIDLDIYAICEKVLLHLIPTLYFYKKKGFDITIDFTDLTTNEKSSITSTDIPDFSEQIFQIKGKDDVIHDFNLNYVVNEVDGKLNAFYCADNRTVAEFKDKEFKLSLPYGYSGYFLLESDYLRSKANNERNDFDIYPIQTDLFRPISWDMINTKLKTEISEIVQEGIPETKNINRTKLKEIQNKRPYLVSYIEDEDIEMAGYLDENYIIEKAKRRFDKAKEKVLTTAGKATYTDTELREAIELTQNELVSYINDRAQVLERLRSLVDKGERVEKIIHNLFMTKNTDDDFFCIGKNNLWLIDDRFTSYSYAASDKRIKDVLSAINENGDDVDILDDKPDLSIFFSHFPNDIERLKAVMIEIKPFDFDSKPARKKHAGIIQAVDYVRAFKDKEKIEEIFGFVITKIDAEFSEVLKNFEFIPLFSTESPIYYHSYPNGVSIYVICAETLVADAEARNKIFLDIIKKQSKLSLILKDEEMKKNDRLPANAKFG